MTALATAMPAADRYRATTFEAFQVTETNRTYRLDPISAATLDEALAEVLAGSVNHKEHLLIRETDDRLDRLHLFAIKRRSAPNYVWRDHRQVREHALYAAPLCVIDGAVLDGLAEGKAMLP